MESEIRSEGGCSRVPGGNARLEMLGWVLSTSGFSVGSQNMNIFQRIDKNNFEKIGEKDTEKCRKIEKYKKKQALMGARLGSQWVLSGFSGRNLPSEYVPYVELVRSSVFAKILQRTHCWIQADVQS